MFVTMVFHHPRPEHTDDFARFMLRLQHEMAGTPGLLSLESYRNPDTDALVALARWSSPTDAGAGVARLMAIGGRRAEWTSEPDEVFQLHELTPAV
jgi:heme-degrading monooxygenase HmoA